MGNQVDAFHEEEAIDKSEIEVGSFQPPEQRFVAYDELSTQVRLP
jgi:hypothetical protein